MEVLERSIKKIIEVLENLVAPMTTYPVFSRRNQSLNSRDFFLFPMETSGETLVAVISKTQ